MEDKLLWAGVGLLAAAIVGGGLKLIDIEIPLINSLPRQVLLGLLGLGLIVYSRNLVPVPVTPASGEDSVADQTAMINLIDQGCILFDWDRGNPAQLPPVVAAHQTERLGRIGGGQIELVGYAEQGYDTDVHARALALHRAQQVAAQLRRDGRDQELVVRSVGVQPGVARFKNYFCGVMINAPLGPITP